ncbi:pyrroloquinoline quinone precursor peptide PqqA [Actinomadura sp. J1-007]|nr:pyrroloquinoline quinone precursor peptide PqqA [Actinomadura sp. J1-007]
MHKSLAVQAKGWVGTATYDPGIPERGAPMAEQDGWITPDFEIVETSLEVTAYLAAET